MDDLLRYRSEFPILERTTYLISNSLGAMPRGVYDAMQSYADMWATRGVRAWEERWWMLAIEVGDKIGALMNAPKNSVSTHQNVTTCQAVVASCFDFSGKRNKVVYSDLNFPSVMYFWEAQRAYGARVHMVKTDDGVTVPTERLLDAIDETTLLVPISHVIFRSAYINDANAIIEKAHRVGAHVVLDTFQSLGTVPIDVQDLNVRVHHHRHATLPRRHAESMREIASGCNDKYPTLSAIPRRAASSDATTMSRHPAC